MKILNQISIGYNEKKNPPFFEKILTIYILDVLFFGHERIE